MLTFTLILTLTSALGFYEWQKTDLHTEAQQHCEVKELFRQWEYKAIGDKEQQTMTSFGVKLLQRIVSLGVWFSHCLMVILRLTFTATTSKVLGS